MQTQTLKKILTLTAAPVALAFSASAAHACNCDANGNPLSTTVAPYTQVQPDTSVAPYTQVEPNTSVAPYTQVEPNTNVDTNAAAKAAANANLNAQQNLTAGNTADQTAVTKSGDAKTISGAATTTSGAAKTISGAATTTGGTITGGKVSTGNQVVNVTSPAITGSGLDRALEAASIVGIAAEVLKPVPQAPLPQAHAELPPVGCGAAAVGVGPSGSHAITSFVQGQHVGAASAVEANGGVCAALDAQTQTVKNKLEAGVAVVRQQAALGRNAGIAAAVPLENAILAGGFGLASATVTTTATGTTTYTPATKRVNATSVTVVTSSQNVAFDATSGTPYKVDQATAIQADAPTVVTRTKVVTKIKYVAHPVVRATARPKPRPACQMMCVAPK